MYALFASIRLNTARPRATALVESSGPFRSARQSSVEQGSRPCAVALLLRWQPMAHAKTLNAKATERNFCSVIADVVMYVCSSTVMRLATHLSVDAEPSRYRA